MALPRSPIGRLAFPGSNRKFVCGNRLWESGFEEASGDTIVAVELHVIEEGGDSVPTGSGGGFGALHVSAGGEHDVAVTHGLADENDFELEQSSHGERPGAEEVDAGRADVPGNQSDWKFLGDGVNAAQAQRELEGGARICAVLWVNANSVCGYAGEAPGMGVRRERGQMYRRKRRGVGTHLRSDREHGPSLRCIV